MDLSDTRSYVYGAESAIWKYMEQCDTIGQRVICIIVMKLVEMFQNNYNYYILLVNIDKEKNLDFTKHM